jgi:hypothetical protein
VQKLTVRLRHGSLSVAIPFVPEWTPTATATQPGEKFINAYFL